MKIFGRVEEKRFWILVLIVSISGFSQGMLLPLIATIFEHDGVSSTLNGLNATGLYLGTLLISPFMEAPLRRYGYRPIIIYGGLIVFVALFSFPLWKNIVFWFVLRMLVGIGDHALHFATQTWITSTSAPHRLGRNIAIYGLSFSVGFGIGPLLTPLVQIFEGLPFIISGLLCMITWSFVFLLKNEFPDRVADQSIGQRHFIERAKVTLLVAWVACLGPFGYGFLESSLNAMYPVYALRNGLKSPEVSLILFTFTLGGVLSQIPLGLLSDRIGRRVVVLIAYGGGAVGFLLAGLAGQQVGFILCSVFIAGSFVGSIFSLGISYMSDMTPKELLPTGNLLCAIFFSFGSLSGPFVGGMILEYVKSFSFLYILSFFFFILFLIALIFGSTRKKAASL